MTDTYSFGEWLKQRRTALRLTQRETAVRAHCSLAMLKKIEADERRPSPELADLLATALELPPDMRPAFIAVARGERPVDALTQSREDTEHHTTAESTALAASPALPQAATRFIGRAAELDQITAQIINPDCRLLTLLGPGGIGKTRLATEAARRVADVFADGALFVPLAAVEDPADIPAAIAQGLRIPLMGQDDTAVQIQRLLQRRNLLLVLDNFEQLATGATLLSDLLAAAPDLTLVVTSRERLNLAEEWLFPVPGLADDAAVTLFAQQSQRVKPDFDARAEATAVAQICHLVGGHALAIELAASWTRYMSCSQVAIQIRQDFGFLSGGARNAPERHHSLRALFDHSWNLLTADEQAVLAKLAVFRGGFAQEQATAVASASWPILLGLVDKSLVEARGDSRFDLHELTRQYAAGRLEASGVLDATRQAHFETYAALATDLNRETVGPRAAVTYRRQELEHDNLQVALGWGLNTGQIAEVLAMTQDLFLFWLRGGHWTTGARWTLAAIEQVGQEDSVLLSANLCQMSTFMAVQGRYHEASPFSIRALPMARRLEDPWALLVNLTVQGQSQPEKETVIAYYDEALAICEAHASEWRFIHYHCELLRLYGDRLLDFGEHAAAEARYRASLAHFRALGDVNQIAYPLGNLGRLALQDGRLEEAHDLINESVGYARKSGSRVIMGDWLFRRGVVHLYLGALDAVAADLREANALYEAVGNGGGQAGVLACLAELALVHDNLEAAQACIHASFERFHTIFVHVAPLFDSSRLSYIGDILESVLRAALVATAAGDNGMAVTLYSKADSLADRHGFVPVQPLNEKMAAWHTAVREALAEDAWDTAVATAQNHTLLEIMMRAKDIGKP